jgi:hypothetical protein
VEISPRAVEASIYFLRHRAFQVVEEMRLVAGVVTVADVALCRGSHGRPIGDG